MFSQNYSDTLAHLQKYKRYGFGLGYNPIYLFNNFDDVNVNLSDSKMPSISKNIYSGSFMFYIYTGFVPNFRVGGFWSDGEKVSKEKEGNINREFHQIINLKGLLIDYAYPIFKRASLACGIILGKGEITQSFSTFVDGEKGYKDFWNEFYTGNISGNFKRNLISSLFIYSPCISMEYAICDFAAIRLGGGYLGSITINTKLEDFYELKNTPKSTEFNNFYIHAGILIGIFMN